MARPDFICRLGRSRFAMLAAWFVIAANAFASSATRSLPLYFEDLVPFPVFIEVNPPTSAEIQTLQETVPSGWSVTGINYGGTWDPSQHVIRWGPFTDNLSRTLAYQLTAPLDAAPSVNFAGQGVFQASDFTVAGPSSLTKRPGIVTRTLPPNYLPGETVTVTAAVRPGASVLAWALQETIPSGWQPFPVPSDASFDAVTGTLKWGPFLDPSPRNITYILRVPTHARGLASFSGLALFESMSVPVSGPSELPIQPSTISRTLPAPFQARTTATVELRVNPAPYVTIFSVEEDVPEGLSVTAVTQGGVWDPSHRRVKWGPFINPAPRVLSFNVSTPDAPADSYVFRGRAAIDNLEIFTLGPSEWLPAQPRQVSTLVSSIPGFFDPLLPLDLDWQCRPAPGTQVHAVELPVPTGWSFTTANHGGAFDPVQRRIKWGPYQDDTPRTLNARLQPPHDATSSVSFLAEGWFDANQVSASGNSITRPFPSTVRRTLPARMTPGVPFLVRIEVVPASTVDLVFVEETVPTEATISGITEGGFWDATGSKIKWGPFTGNLRRTLSFQVTPLPEIRRNAAFVGLAIFNSQAVTTDGPNLVARNHAPSPQPDLLSRSPAANAKFSSIELLANDGDVDGDASRILRVDPQSAAGGTVRLIGPWIFYDAPPGRPPEDQFTYTVEDLFGATAVASATVRFSSTPIASRLAIVAVVPQSGGTALVRFRAVPGTLCRIEVSRDLRSWTFLAESTVGPSGLGEVIDPAPTASPVRFYRASAP